MKYYDENDVEVPESEIDHEKGRIILDTKVVKHHEATPEVQEESHYEVSTFYFEDGTTLTVESQDDPHIGLVDPENGVFDYIDQGEEKILRGIELVTVIDVERKEAQDAWDETEDFYRWIPYTEEELEEQRKAQEIAEKQHAFIESGPDRMEAIEEDLGTTVETVDSLGVELGDLSIAFVELMESI